jgi:hypothetical protein
MHSIKILHDDDRIRPKHVVNGQIKATQFQRHNKRCVDRGGHAIIYLNHTHNTDLIYIRLVSSEIK